MRKTPLSATQCHCAAPQQTTASEMSVKMNQQLSNTNKKTERKALDCCFGPTWF